MLRRYWFLPGLLVAGAAMASPDGFDPPADTGAPPPSTEATEAPTEDAPAAPEASPADPVPDDPGAPIEGPAAETGDTATSAEDTASTPDGAQPPPDRPPGASDEADAPVEPSVAPVAPVAPPAEASADVPPAEEIPAPEPPTPVAEEPPAAPPRLLAEEPPDAPPPPPDAPPPTEPETDAPPADEGDYVRVLSHNGRSLGELRLRYLGAGYRRLPRESKVTREALEVLAWACTDARAPAFCRDLGRDLSKMRAYWETYGDAFETVLQACVDGVPGACTATLDFRRSRSTRSFDPPTPAGLLALGCSEGRFETCEPHGRRQKRDARAPVWEAGCEGGDGASCASLARAVRRDDPLEADTLETRACELGHGPSCWDRYRKERRPRRPDLATADYDRLVRSCDLGSGKACVWVARTNLRGPRRDQDPVEALARFDEACDVDHYPGCRQAARMFRRGEGTEKDRAKSRYYKERGVPKAPGRLLATVGLPNALAIRGEGVLPLPIGPALSLGASVGGTPKIPNILPAALTLHGDARLYPHHDARGFFVSGGVTGWRWIADGPGYGQDPSASASVLEDDDQAWGAASGTAGAFMAGGTLGGLLHRGPVIIEIEAGLYAVTSPRTVQTYPPILQQVPLPPLMPIFQIGIGGAIR